MYIDQSWYNTCIPWLSIRACSDKESRITSIFAITYFVLTTLSIITLLGVLWINIRKRTRNLRYLLIFTIHNIVWAALCILYDGFRIARKDYNGIHPSILGTLESFGTTTLISSINFLVSNWINLLEGGLERDKPLTSPSFWNISSPIFVISTTIFTILAGINVRYYNIFYRISLLIHVLMIIAIVGLLLYCRPRLEEKANGIYKQRARTICFQIIGILVPCGAFAVVHAIILDKIDSTAAHFVVRSCYRYGSCLYCLFWCFKFLDGGITSNSSSSRSDRNGSESMFRSMSVNIINSRSSDISSHV